MAPDRRVRAAVVRRTPLQAMTTPNSRGGVNRATCDLTTTGITAHKRRSRRGMSQTATRQAPEQTMPSDPANEAAAAARRAERRLRNTPNAVLGGQPIGECPCGGRFDYGTPSADVENLDPCPGCGSREWYKWGYRYNGEEIRRDQAWDRYDAPPSASADGTPRDTDRSNESNQRK